jgi:hypothetical protein
MKMKSNDNNGQSQTLSISNTSTCTSTRYGLETRNALNLRALSDFLNLKSGPDGTRTRDPMRDRHVF